MADNQHDIQEREVRALERIADVLDELVLEVAGRLDVIADAIDALEPSVNQKCTCSYRGITR